MSPLAAYAHRALLAEIEAAKNAPSVCRYCERTVSSKSASYACADVARARTEHAPSCDWIAMTHGAMVVS